jgi:hypothetical protein
MKFAAANLKSEIKALAVGCATFIQGDGSRASWDDNVYQQGRGFSNSVRQLPPNRDEFWKTLQKLRGFDLGALKLDGDDAKSITGRKTVAKIALNIAKEVKAFRA